MVFCKKRSEMISIKDMSECTGCTACVTSCPVQCIVMHRDKDGFDYPIANPDLCVGCGRCDSVCPVINRKEPVLPYASYAARIPEYVNVSSSGGVFAYLAGKIIEDEGVVFGAVLNEDMTVGHMEADTMDRVQKIRGSKYVQSDLYSVFEDVKSYLQEGRKVLFTGTPCQVAGLNSFLGRRYDNLLTVDVACHGVPSPGLWKRYADALARKCGGLLEYVNFRDKSKSWMHYSMTYGSTSRTFSVPYMDDPYLALFVQGITLRPSCYSCPAKDGRSGSDLTLADLWDVKHVIKEFDDDKGVSLVVAYTEKGLSALDGADLREVSYSEAVAGNGGFVSSKQMSPERDKFFQGLPFSSDLFSYMNGYVVRRPLVVRIYKRIRSVLSQIKRRICR